MSGFLSNFAITWDIQLICLLKTYGILYYVRVLTELELRKENQVYKCDLRQRFTANYDFKEMFIEKYDVTGRFHKQNMF